MRKIQEIRKIFFITINKFIIEVLNKKSPKYFQIKEMYLLLQPFINAAVIASILSGTIAQ